MGFAVQIATLLMGLGVWSDASHAASSRNDTPKSLQHFVDSGKLQARIRDDVEKTGQADVILVIGDSDVNGLVGWLKERLGTRNDTPDIIAQKAGLYTRKKQTVLTAISPSNFQLLQDYDHLPVMQLRVDAEALSGLLQQDEVIAINADRAFSPHLAESLPLIGAPQVRSTGVTGSGTSVAVLDTGVNYTLSAFGNCTAPGTPEGCKVAYVQDFATNDNSLDDDGHGTNVSGIVVGVAPDTKILGLDVFRSDGYAYDSDLLAALNWVLANKAAYNIAAVNMSMGGGKFTAQCPDDTLAAAINNLQNAGVVTVISSGNDGYTDAVSSPACIPAAVSVGAVYDANLGRMNWSICIDQTTAADKLTCFSNSAPFLTMLAPGALITAADITMAGTSQASPHVSGAVALVRGEHGALSAAEISAKLAASGVPVSGKGITRPRLDLVAALRFPQLTAAPAAHDFGYLPAGSTAPTQTFTATNTGAMDLAIGTISLSGAAADFTIQNDSCSGQTVPPTGSCDIGISFSPQSAGLKGSTLAIPSDDPDRPLQTLSLSGTGGAQFTLSAVKNGTGTVTSTPAGINCGPDCTEPYAPGTAVTLTATAGTGGVFAGWSGGGCSGTGPCMVTLNADTAITALFNSLQPVRLVSASVTAYPSLQTAYNAAAGGDTILGLTQTLNEDLNFNRDIAITVTGGYDDNYTSPVSVTTINGTLTISGGTVTVANLALF